MAEKRAEHGREGPPDVFMDGHLGDAVQVVFHRVLDRHDLSRAPQAFDGRVQRRRLSQIRSVL